MSMALATMAITMESWENTGEMANRGFEWNGNLNGMET
jgi:hypothetical protein